MATTGYRFPTTDTISSGVWVNPTNVQADDGNFAVCNLSTKNLTAVRMQGGYGFSSGVVPDDATVTGMNLRVEWRVSTATSVIAILGVRARVSTTNLLIHENALEPTTFSTQVFDITAERAWDPGDLRDGMLITNLEPRNGNDASDPGYMFEYVSIEAIYSLPVMPRTLTGACNLDGVGSDGIFLGNALE